MVGKVSSPLNRLMGRIPRTRGELEETARSLMRLVFWGALLAPVVIVPAYYLLVAFGVLPPVHLPG